MVATAKGTGKKTGKKDDTTTTGKKQNGEGTKKEDSGAAKKDDSSVSKSAAGGTKSTPPLLVCDTKTESRKEGGASANKQTSAKTGAASGGGFKFNVPPGEGEKQSKEGVDLVNLGGVDNKSQKEPPPREQSKEQSKEAVSALKIPSVGGGSSQSSTLLKDSGMKIISEIPSRIKAVEKVMAMESFSRSDLNHMFQDLSNVKPQGLGFPLAALMQGAPNPEDGPPEEEDEEGDTIGTNPKLEEMFSVLRPLLSQVTTDVGALRLMMSSQISEVTPEDIQDEETGQQIMIVLSVLNKVEEFPKREFEAWSQYHLLRNEMVMKLIPSHKNTFQAIHDLDCKLIMHLRSTAYKLMETYMTLNTMVEETVRKLQKIDAPGSPGKKARLYKSMYN